jgi:hypothetical protein
MGVNGKSPTTGRPAALATGAQVCSTALTFPTRAMTFLSAANALTALNATLGLL